MAEDAETFDYNSDRESVDEHFTEPTSVGDILSNAFSSTYGPTFNAGSFEPQVLNLPPHFRCASHTLSLLATTDFENVLLAHR